MANENPESASLNGFLSHGMAWEHFWDFKLDVDLVDATVQCHHTLYAYT